MITRAACVLLLTIPLAAQSPFRTTRHAGLPSIIVGDKFASGDLDGDGDIDLFVANDNSANQLLFNDGYGRFTDVTTGRFVMQPGHNATHGVDLADIDGDSDLDILIGNDDNISNRVYVNNGLGFFTDTTATALPPQLHWTNHQVVADFDGDGDVDWLAIDNPGCHYYRNNGLGVFTDATTAVAAGLGTFAANRYGQAARAADVDGDGDLDALMDGPVLIINQGGVLVGSPVPLPAVTGSANWFADIDGDGDQDILVGQARFVLQNQGNGTFVDVTATAFAATHNGAIASFDVDLDGDLDLVTAPSLLLNNGQGVFTAQAGATSLTWGYNLGFASADFDGDGDIDLPGKPNFLRQVNAVTAPARGQSYSVDFHARAGSMMVAAAALGASNTPAGPFGVLRLDQTTMVTLGFLNVTTSPSTLTWSLPNNPAFAGLQLHYQALIADPVNGVRLSNAIRDLVP